MGDSTLNFANAAAFADGIQALQADGVPGGHQLSGEHATLSTYYFAAFNDF